MIDATPIDEPAASADAELMALAEACVEAGRAREAAADAAQEAEAHRQPLAPPTAVIKTRRDAELGLFDGHGLGAPYRKSEIELLRPLAECTTIPPSAAPVLTRAAEIVSAWRAWRSALETYAADPGLDAAADRHEELLRRLLATPALTLDGAVAKARAFNSLFGDDAELARRAESDFEAFGPSESVLARALARDLIRLARAALSPASTGARNGRDDSPADRSRYP